MNRPSSSQDSTAPDQSHRPSDLDRKVAFLLDPKSYSEALRSVEANETHMSWVFLAGDHAYKLKKPVRYEFLDFSTLDARRASCEAELDLNRRLAPDVYLDTVPLTQDPAGTFHLGAGGGIVDWLVKMRRLPAAGTLLDAIRGQSVRADDIRRLVRELTSFYGRAEKVPASPREYRLGIEKNIHDTRTELCRSMFGLDLRFVDDIASGLLAFLSYRGDVLGARSGKLVDGHGDLRPEHVYLGPNPVIIDCIEFNRDFRIIDPVDELAYLVMECELLGAGFMHDWIFPTYRELAHDEYEEAILPFYKAYRAYIRAKIAIWHLADDTVTDTAKWSKRCSDYLRIAERHLGSFAKANARQSAVLDCCRPMSHI